MSNIANDTFYGYQHYSSPPLQKYAKNISSVFICSLINCMNDPCIVLKGLKTSITYYIMKLLLFDQCMGTFHICYFFQSYIPSIYPLLKHVHHTLDDILIRVGLKLHIQKLGVPVATNCAPLVADLFNIRETYGISF